MDELIKTLREHAEWAEANQWEVPITLADDLRKAADELEKRRWVQFEEKRPEDAQDILVWGPSYDRVAVTTYYELWGPSYTHTHWMSLPEAPKEDKV